MLDPRIIPKLAALLGQYYDTGEFGDLARAFGITFETDGLPVEPESQQEWLDLCGQLAKRIDERCFRTGSACS